jgi:hypothetical protein
MSRSRASVNESSPAHRARYIPATVMLKAGTQLTSCVCHAHTFLIHPDQIVSGIADVRGTR